MNRKKAVLIGAGSIGGFKPDHVENELTGIISHGHAINRLCNPVAVVDPDKEKRFYVKNKWRFAMALPDVDLVPDKADIDLWVIATPPETHRRIFEQLLPYIRGKTVLLEKPVGMDRQDAELIAGFAKRNKVRVYVNYQRCYLSSFQKKAVLDFTGDFEEVVLHYVRGFHRDACHFFALLRLWGVEIKNPQLSKIGYADFSKADLTLSGMADHVHLIAHDGRVADTFRVEVVGKKGRVVFEDHGKLLCSYPHKQEATFGSSYKSWGHVPEVMTATGLDNGLEAVYNHILARQPGFSVGDAVAVWQMMEKFMEAK
jgi:predicted dehydrogenase